MNRNLVTRQYEELRAKGYEPRVASTLAVGILLADKFDKIDRRLLAVVDALEEGAGLVPRRV
jgi:hypothetical protein